MTLTAASRTPTTASTTRRRRRIRWIAEPNATPCATNHSSQTPSKNLRQCVATAPDYQSGYVRHVSCPHCISTDRCTRAGQAHVTGLWALLELVQETSQVGTRDFVGVFRIDVLHHEQALVPMLLGCQQVSSFPLRNTEVFQRYRMPKPFAQSPMDVQRLRIRRARIVEPSAIGVRGSQGVQRVCFLQHVAQFSVDVNGTLRRGNRIVMTPQF